MKKQFQLINNFNEQKNTLCCCLVLCPEVPDPLGEGCSCKNSVITSQNVTGSVELHDFNCSPSQKNTSIFKQSNLNIYLFLDQECKHKETH